MKKLIAIFLVFVSIFGFVACDSDTEVDTVDIPLTFDKVGEYYYPKSFYAFGVTVEMHLYGKNSQKAAAQSAFDEFKAAVQALDAQCSTSIPTSDVAKFNLAGKNEEVPIGEHTKAMYDLSLELNEQSEGLFDPCSFNLVDYWGFAPFDASTINPPLYDWLFGDLARHPMYNREAEETDRFTDEPSLMVPALRPVSKMKDESGNLNVVVYQATTGENAGKWVMKKTTDDVKFTDSFSGQEKTYNLRIDFGAVAKGYAADLGKALAEKYGLTKGYISVNSSMYLLKLPNGETEEESEACIPIAVRDPRHQINNKGELAAIEAVYKNMGLSTSADSEKYYYYPTNTEARRYCHIINPTTGYPLGFDQAGVRTSSSVISVTLMHESSAMTDAYATVGMLMGEGGNWQKSLDWLEAHGAWGLLVVQEIAESTVTYKLVPVGMTASQFTINPNLSSIFTF